MGLLGLLPGIAQAQGLKVALQADDGKYFARCNGCQTTVTNRFPDTITTHVTSPTQGAYAQFELINVGNGKIALKADTGKFVGRCNGCIVNGAKPDFATVHVTDSTQPYAQFTPVPLANGKYGLKADTGKFLARCNGCSPGAKVPNQVAVHATDPNTEAYAQWNIIPVNFPTGSKIALQADDGKYFARCNGCQTTVTNRFPDTITTHVTSPAQGAYAQFSVVNVGNGKIALKADTGKFVARCNGCIVNGAKPDFATVHVTDSTQPYAQFTPVLLANGKYGLKADTGKFLARCNGCSPGAKVPNQVAVHATDPNTEAYAQWNIIFLP
jgi:hypothetical protein